MVLSSPSSFTIEYGTAVLTVVGHDKKIKKIKPKLICIEELKRPVNGFKYKANFAYENDNDFTVVVPIGDLNKIRGRGRFKEDQPTQFLPGGGKFSIYFDGSKITWLINNTGINQYSAMASEASSNSARCKNWPNTGHVANFSEAPGEVETTGTDRIYPNPANQVVLLELNTEERLTPDQLYISSINGQRHTVSSMHAAGKFKWQLNIGQLPAGQYILIVQLKSGQKIFRFTKL